MIKKKQFYQLLVGVSLLAGVVASPLLAPMTVQAANVGTFTVADVELNVRREPSTNGEIVTKYGPGQVIEYDKIVEGDGYRWISYIGHSSGERNYVAIEKLDGSQSFGSLSNGGGTTNNTSEPAPGELSFLEGEWVNKNGETQYVTEASLREKYVMSLLESDDAGYKYWNAKVKDGSVGIAIMYMPAGHSKYAEISDQNKERLFFGQGATEETILYRSSSSTPSQPPAESTESNQAESAKVSAKAWTGDNPYSADFIKSIDFSTRGPQPIKPKYYSLYDVDANGTPELLLGDDNGGDISVYGVYSLINSSPERIIALEDNAVVTIYENQQMMTGGRAGLAGMYYYIVELRSDNSGFDTVESGEKQLGTGEKIVNSPEIDSNSFDWKLIADVDKEPSSPSKKKETKSSSSKKSKKEKTESKSDKITLDRLVGKWVNDYGTELEITADGKLLTSEKNYQLVASTDERLSEGLAMFSVQDEEGNFMRGGIPYGSLQFASAGVSAEEAIPQKDNSDTSRDRFEWINNGLWFSYSGAADSIFYRKDDQTTTTKKTKSTQSKKKTTTKSGKWNSSKSQQLADFMVSWGNEMNQPGYVNIFDKKQELIFDGQPLSISYDKSGQSKADYTIVEAYEYDRGGGLYHRYHFAILKDGSATVIYSEAQADGQVTVSYLNTQNEKLRNYFVNLVG